MCLHEGIDVAQRHYMLLGYSSGQVFSWPFVQKSAQGLCQHELPAKSMRIFSNSIAQHCSRISQRHHGAGKSLISSQLHLTCVCILQLREQSAWFWAAPTDGPTADEMRAWMGSLDSIRCIAKHTARMGQCFSTTYDTLRLQVSCRGT